VACRLVGAVLVSARVDDAMVSWLFQRIAGLGLGVSVLIVTLFALSNLGWQAYQRGDFVGLWLTPDQQARLAYENLDFPGAFETFVDPAWKGVAAYDSGKYSDAATAFGRIPTAKGFYNRGNSFMKNREYAKAITAFELAVEEAPAWQDAQDNFALATYTLEYIERVREQSDTGDESELSADDYVFDNKKERGKEMVITQQSTIELESAEKWMRGVNTKTRDFLRTRFLLEATRQGQR